MLQKRDWDLFHCLLESRVMNAIHIATLYFRGSREAAKKRLQKLKAAGFVAERKRRASEPSVLFLTGKAFDILREHGHLSEYPKLSRSALEKRARVSEFTLRHELEVMDVKAAFHSALRKSDKLSIAEFSTWPLLHEFRASRNGHSEEILVKPDGFIRIQEKELEDGLSEHTFFFELDRSSETLDTLVSRAACYLSYYRSGGFAMKNGATRNAFKEFPFRVLIVLKTSERRNNTAERLLQNIPPIFTQVYLSTFKEVTTDPLDHIWITPAAYRDAVKGTTFDIDRQREFRGYRRETLREHLVEQKIKKCRLLVDDENVNPSV